MVQSKKPMLHISMLLTGRTIIQINLKHLWLQINGSKLLQSYNYRANYYRANYYRAIIMCVIKCVIKCDQDIVNRTVILL